MTSTTTRRSALLRKLAVAIASLGLLGAAAQSQARVERDRAALEARVQSMRDAISQARPEGASDIRLTQWFNWGNWNNWNNWPNWGNWGNWPNHR
jgi:hypothetical protein